MEKIKLNRSVAWTGKIEDKGLDRVLREVVVLHEKDPDEFVNLFVCSGGGSVSYASAFYDFIKATGIKVRTIGLGEVDSCALIVFLSGSERLIGPHTSLFFHQLKSSPEFIQVAQSSELRGVTEEHGILIRYYFGIVESSTGGKFPHEEVKRIVLESGAIDSNKAVELGLAHALWLP